jgi:hypothetical protein
LDNGISGLAETEPTDGILNAKTAFRKLLFQFLIVMGIFCIQNAPNPAIPEETLP